MRTEGLFLIKPNATTLLEESQERILESGLTIDYIGRVTLTPEDVELLYEPRMNTDHEHRIKDIMTTGECVVILVSGDGASEKLKEIKGKTYSGKGMRGVYAVDFIDNKIHSTDNDGEYLTNLLIFFTESKIDG